MNSYDRAELVRQMNERDKVDFIHRITESLKEDENDSDAIKEYNRLLKEADKIFVDNKEFYL